LISQSGINITGLVTQVGEFASSCTHAVCDATSSAIGNGIIRGITAGKALLHNATAVDDESQSLSQSSVSSFGSRMSTLSRSSTLSGQTAGQLLQILDAAVEQPDTDIVIIIPPEPEQESQGSVSSSSQSMSDVSSDTDSQPVSADFDSQEDLERTEGGRRKSRRHLKSKRTKKIKRHAKCKRGYTKKNKRCRKSRKGRKTHKRR
jgi:hypothetical protein